jgi:thiosulfate/3-mercaptopyruvate sulfurtransferase
MRMIISMRQFMTVLCTAVALLGLTGAARAAEPLVSAAWLAAHLADQHVVVLDLRPVGLHLAAHIPGAVSADCVNIAWTEQTPSGAAGALPPVGRLAATIGELGVGDADQVTIVSDDFAGAARVYWTFKVLGHAEVSILDGGMRAWTGPLANGRVAQRPATFTVHYDGSVRAGLPDVAAAISTGDATLVDARPMSQWNGSERSPIVRVGGHLPGAVSIDQGKALAPDGRLRPQAELAALFADTGSKPAIAYCNAGHLSATDWFVMSEVLHRPGVRLYDGSMSEWAANPSRPVQR